MHSLTYELDKIIISPISIVLRKAVSLYYDKSGHLFDAYFQTIKIYVGEPAFCVNVFAHQAPMISGEYVLILAAPASNVFLKYVCAKCEEGI